MCSSELGKHTCACCRDTLRRIMGMIDSGDLPLTVSGKTQ
jgi:hypothetical protein